MERSEYVKGNFVAVAVIFVSWLLGLIVNLLLIKITDTGSRRRTPAPPKFSTPPCDLLLPEDAQCPSDL